MLECRVRGTPRPVISWTKDGESITTDDKYLQFDQDDGTCKLIISNPEELDSGTYTCNAENAVAEDQTSHDVEFTGESQYILEKTHRYFHRDPNRPQFQNTLGEHQVPAGGTIALQAEIVFNPAEVEWLFQKQPITLTDKVKTFYDRGVYSLIISSVTYGQSGAYTCRASNNFGKNESTAHVYVVKPTGNGGKCPLFSARPESEMTVMAGDPLSISFKLIGDPKPKCNIRLSLDLVNLLYLLNSCIAFFSSDFL